MAVVTVSLVKMCPAIAHSLGCWSGPASISDYRFTTPPINQTSIQRTGNGFTIEHTFDYRQVQGHSRTTLKVLLWQHSADSGETNFRRRVPRNRGGSAFSSRRFEHGGVPSGASVVRKFGRVFVEHGATRWGTGFRSPYSLALVGGTPAPRSSGRRAPLRSDPQPAIRVRG